MEVFIYGLGGIFLVATCFLKPRRALSWSLIAVINLHVLVPSFGPSNSILIFTNAISIMILGVTLARNIAYLGRRTFSFFPLLMVVWLAIDSSVGASSGRVLTVAGSSAVLLLAILVNSVARKRGEGIVLGAIASTVPLQTVIAILEQFRAVKVVWPRGTAIDNIDDRQHQFLNFLVGRSMGTTGHPIILGVIAALGIFACLYLAAEGRRKRFLFLAAMAVIPLLLSGTRSAIAGLVVLILIWLALKLQIILKICLILAIIVSYLIVIILDPFDLKFNELAGSVSFTHRSGVIASGIDLLSNNSLEELVFGHPGQNTQEIFSSGSIGGVSGFLFFDNQIIRLLALSGLISLAILAIAVISGWKHGDQSSRLILIFILVMFWSFDVLTWQLPYLIFVLAMSGLGASSTRTKNSTRIERILVSE